MYKKTLNHNNIIQSNFQLTKTNVIMEKSRFNFNKKFVFKLRKWF